MGYRDGHGWLGRALGSFELSTGQPPRGPGGGGPIDPQMALNTPPRRTLNISRAALRTSWTAQEVPEAASRRASRQHVGSKTNPKVARERPRKGIRWDSRAPPPSAAPRPPTNAAAQPTRPREAPKGPPMRVAMPPNKNSRGIGYDVQFCTWSIGGPRLKCGRRAVQAEEQN